MVYINSRGEIIDETSPTARNIFWKFVMFFVSFFKSLVGIEDTPKSSNSKSKRPDQRSNGGSFGGGGGSGGSGGSNRRPFGPRGFKSITDLPPPPSPCAGGACGL